MTRFAASIITSALFLALVIPGVIAVKSGKKRLGGKLLFWAIVEACVSFVVLVAWWLAESAATAS